MYLLTIPVITNKRDRGTLSTGGHLWGQGHTQYRWTLLETGAHTEQVDTFTGKVIQVHLTAATFLDGSGSPRFRTPLRPRSVGFGYRENRAAPDTKIFHSERLKGTFPSDIFPDGDTMIQCCGAGGAEIILRSRSRNFKFFICSSIRSRSRSRIYF